MIKVDVSDEIRALVAKAANAAKSEDAMRFSQAACNAANAMACVHNVQRDKESDKK